MNTGSETTSPSGKPWTPELDSVPEFDTPRKSLIDPPQPEKGGATPQRLEDLGMLVVATSAATDAVPRGIRATLSLKTGRAMRVSRSAGTRGPWRGTR
jgi:hypothetical protein